MMLRPPKLLVGGTIGIVGPGSPMKPERLVKGIRYLERRGYRVKLGEHIRDVYGYLAGSDVDRARDFNAMFQDPAVDAIICTRGGYGTPRILHKIDYDAVAANPKILVGYSDITGLQLALFARTGLVTFSGPMAAVEMGKGIHAFTEENFWPLVTSTEVDRKLTGNAGPLRTIHAGTAEGTLLGGNLSLIAALTGTAFLPDLDGTILVIEDIGEEPYQIDRNLSQLRLAGVLQRIAGLPNGRGGRGGGSGGRGPGGGSGRGPGGGSGRGPGGGGPGSGGGLGGDGSIFEGGGGGLIDFQSIREEQLEKLM
ncbi:LD-carboxypeptidase, partial [candidate division KSB1 bacterium]|nr:LD-carboxypeptidase [candidate division KSB1 bacterium]